MFLYVYIIINYLTYFQNEKKPYYLATEKTI
jgi:hypothetical protein